MKCRIFPFIYVFIFSLFGVVKAQSLPHGLTFNSFTTQHGLSNNKINTILQDKAGFIWIATEDGLNRFDGYQFKVYRNNSNDSKSISNNSIWSLFEDDLGYIWIGTKSGELNRYNSRKDIFERWKIVADGEIGNSITKIYISKKGVIWVGTYQSGLFRFDVKSGDLQNWKYNPKNQKSISNNFVTDIYEDEEGTLWIGTYNGLNKFIPSSDNNEFVKYFHNPTDENTLSSNLVWSITKSVFEIQSIWVGTSNGLTSYNVDKDKFSRVSTFKIDSFQFGNSVSSVFEEKLNNQTILWLSTYAGLVRLNLETGESTRFMKTEDDDASIVSNEINRIIRDKSGVIWLATENGLSSFTSKSLKFNSFFNSSGKKNHLLNFPRNSVKAIVSTADGTVYFGTASGILVKKKFESSVNRISQSSQYNVWSLAPGLSNDLWVGTYGQGLKNINLASGEIKSWEIKSPTFETSAFDYIKSLHLTRNKNLLVGFWGGGLARLNPSNGEYKIWINETNDPNSLSFNDVWAIHEDKLGRIWIGTNGGGLNLAYRRAGLFNESADGKFIRFTKGKIKSGSINNNIYAICEPTFGIESQEKSKTILWIGTSDGLTKMSIAASSDPYNLPDSSVEVEHYSSKHGLVDNSVKSILEDESGNLWIGTNSGISFFNTMTKQFENYSEYDGLIGNESNFNSAVRLPDGLMFFGSDEGVNIFNQQMIKPSDYSPSVLLTDFQIFNKSVMVKDKSDEKFNISYAEEISLTHDQNVFSFQFAALDLNSPHSIQYAYKMEGFDKEWVYSGNRRFVTYTNLDPGEYTFKIKSTNSDGVWSENIKTLMVVITPPLWRTPFAYVFYVIIIIVGLLAIRKFETNRSKLRNELRVREFEVKKQKELEVLKSRFFANLSHEFRTPLTLIRGPLEQLLENKAGENVNKYYEMIYRNSEKLQILIDQLLELTQLESAAIPLKARKENLGIMFQGLVSSFESLAKEKDVKLYFNLSNEVITAWIDRDKLEKIINNLLSNAFKFTPEKGKISVTINKIEILEKSYAQVKISDSGIGIPEDKISRIFDRFFQVDDSQSRKFGGSGIGLALVKELVDLHRWDISVESKIGDGAIFLLNIPLWDSYLEDNQKLKADYENEIKDYSISETLTQPEMTEVNNLTINDYPKDKAPNEKPTILIVDDSMDVRSYLNELLKSEYDIIEASNGEKGIESALELLPDLIISDVMMPEMDGIEFCKKIKLDWKTSHIPVILLTAKASSESRIEGLETGADDYVTKPFNSRELSVRIKNLLLQRKNLIEKFGKSERFSPEKITHNKADQEFINRALEIVEKNISDFEFDSENFAKEIFLSRSQLHRKIHSLTGQSTGEFIRTIKLKKAAGFIIENKLSITQISFEVGFNSPSHFTKAFRQFFDCLPSEFLSKTNHN